MANTPVRQYIGARYVPIFANPIEWSNNRTYEPLTIVSHAGNSYTSRQYTPLGIDITNNDYWALTGNYNAQIEQYRQETASKIATVAHDTTLTGKGTATDPLKIPLTSNSIIDHSENDVVYTALFKHDNTTAMGFTAGEGLTATNTKNNETITSIRLSDTTQNKLKLIGKRKYVLLGDSWTENNKPVFSTLQELNPGTEWHNYGVSGYIVQRLPEEINVAKADPTLHPEEITDVIIVIGTNNVFWTNLNEYPDITEQDAYNGFITVRNFFPNANIHLFPNNSKTLNDGRNKLYRNIINGAIRANISVHPESLYWCAGHLNYYSGDDQGGVQHLSNNGYIEFARFINNIIHGGNPFNSSQWIGTTVWNDYTNPTNMQGIDDNTLKITRLNGSNMINVGYITNAIVKMTYYSDEKLTLTLKGIINIDPEATDLSANNFITCENWFKKIAPHTIPYIFAGDTVTYPQPKALTGLDNDYTATFVSTTTLASTAQNIYITLPTLQKKNYNFSLQINNALTSIVNFGL